MIDAHIDQAKSHGVTGFIATWWGQGTFDDRAFVTLLERAAKKDFKVTIYWERAPGEGRAQIEHAVNDLAYVLPFFYDDAAGKPAPMAARVGLPVSGGWEAPPAGVALKFHLNTQALPGLPPAVPFPATGDLRWRPGQRALAAKGDVYVPLAELKDAVGKTYGEGMVYIEHTAPPLRNGRSLYVWMRMPEALGVDQGLFSVFQFAAGKSGPGK